MRWAPLAKAGAYFACDTVVKVYLINFAPGFIYSTALPHPLLYAASKTWDMIRHMDTERSHLHQLRQLLQQGLQHLNLPTTPSTTHIFEIIPKDSWRTIYAAQQLKEQGITVSAVRSPTVPIGSSHLRLALRANRSANDVKTLLKTLSLIERPDN